MSQSPADSDEDLTEGIGEEDSDVEMATPYEIDEGGSGESTFLTKKETEEEGLEEGPLLTKKETEEEGLEEGPLLIKKETEESEPEDASSLAGLAITESGHGDIGEQFPAPHPSQSQAGSDIHSGLTSSTVSPPSELSFDAETLIESLERRPAISERREDINLYTFLLQSPSFQIQRVLDGAERRLMSTLDDFFKAKREIEAQPRSDETFRALLDARSDILSEIDNISTDTVVAAFERPHAPDRDYEQFVGLCMEAAEEQNHEWIVKLLDSTDGDKDRLNDQIVDWIEVNIENIKSDEFGALLAVIEELTETEWFTLDEQLVDILSRGIIDISMDGLEQKEPENTLTLLKRGEGIGIFSYGRFVDKVEENIDQIGPAGVLVLLKIGSRNPHLRNQIRQVFVEYTDEVGLFSNYEEYSIKIDSWEEFSQKVDLLYSREDNTKLLEEHIKTSLKLRLTNLA